MLGDRFVAYELTPPPERASEDFVRFVQEEVFPAVKMSPTRVGVIIGVTIFFRGRHTLSPLR